MLVANWKALIDKGADVNAPNSEGITPFAMAAGRRDLPIDALAFLVERGASLEAGLAEGKSAISYAQGVSPDRRLALETRFRIPQWSQERSIKMLVVCRDQYTLSPLSIDESSEAGTIPTVRAAVLKLADQLNPMPLQYSIRLYRANKNLEVEMITEIPGTGGQLEQLPETPAMQWGDVLVVFKNEKQPRRTVPRPR